MRTIVAAAPGACVHVAAVMNIPRLAEAVGWRTVFPGPATPVEAVVAAARREGDAFGRFREVRSWIS